MSETGQMISQASPEFRPRSLGYRRLCCLLTIRRSELFARHVCKLADQFRLSAYPLRQVIQGLLGLYGCAVKAEHKCERGRGIVPLLEEPVVYQGKEQLAHIRCWQDTTLDREIVLGRFVGDIACPTQQIFG